MTDPSRMPGCERPTLDPEAVCAECGAVGAIAFDGVTLCPDCYSKKGSCCAEAAWDENAPSD